MPDPVQDATVLESQLQRVFGPRLRVSRDPATGALRITRTGDDGVGELLMTVPLQYMDRNQLTEIEERLRNTLPWRSGPGVSAGHPLGRAA